MEASPGALRALHGLQAQAKKREGRVRLQVEDAGAGIAPELQALLFEPFQRLGHENSAIQGTGIGLALCLELASLMGGHMGVHSVPGQGSCFWIEFEPSAEPVHLAGAPAVRR